VSSQMGIPVTRNRCDLESR